MTVAINPFGAELQSIMVNGEERLWQGDPAVWEGRAPVLFPVAGSFLRGRYIYNGTEYAMSAHGFASKRMFVVAEQSENAVTLVLNGKEDNYPFDYELHVTFELPENSLQLRVIYDVKNRGTAPMYYGIGSHEAYACPEGVENYCVEFPKDETLVNYLLTGAQCNHNTEELTLENGALRLQPQMFARCNTLIFPKLHSRSVTLRHIDSNRSVRVDFEDFDNLLLWQVPGAKYLCIEPWSHMPEYTDHDGDLTHKPGILCLQGGESKRFVHSATFE